MKGEGFRKLIGVQDADRGSISGLFRGALRGILASCGVQFRV